MKQGLTILKTSLLCFAAASWLKMCFPRLEWETWLELIGKPWNKWLGALVGAPLFEAYYFFWGYLLAGSVFLYGIKALERKEKSLGWRTTMLLGAACGAGCYGVSAIMSKAWLGWLWPIGVIELAGIYAVVGGLYGFLYYRWVSQKQLLNATRLL